jgi:hypothetical protein
MERLVFQAEKHRGSPKFDGHFPPQVASKTPANTRQAYRQRAIIREDGDMVKGEA